VADTAAVLASPVAVTGAADGSNCLMEACVPPLLLPECAGKGLNVAAPMLIRVRQNSRPAKRWDSTPKAAAATAAAALVADDGDGDDGRDAAGASTSLRD
jgi:hypothetical protein